MPTLVQIPRSRRSAAAAAALIADYTAFDRQRLYRRQYIRAFGGLALIVFLGAAFGFEPRREAMIVAALFATPPVILAAIEAMLWRRLVRRMRTVRASVSQAA